MLRRLVGVERDNVFKSVIEVVSDLLLFLYFGKGRVLFMKMIMILMIYR